MGLGNRFFAGISLALLLSNAVLVLLFSNAVTAQAGAGGAADKEFAVGTLYYGLKEYSWPINYLNAIKESDIDSEILTLKNMGFNTIILLASWSEFEPEIGKPSSMAYRKMGLIIGAAKRNGIKVMIRIPYAWSFAGEGTEDLRERIVYALLGHRDYRQSFLGFLRDFQTKVIDKNDNVISKFGSWEDYYVLRDLFFSGDSAGSALTRERFYQDTHIKSGEVVRNGENYDIFNNWMDAKILEMSKEIGSYGYETRTDADLFTKNKIPNWHFHNKFYKNESDGDVIAYWAPYFGQKNQGEKIDADQATKSFAWMLDSIAAETNMPPFIDQLNFFDNSPGTGANAQIKTDQLPAFFQKMGVVLVERTSGYAFWTIRDYRHNIIFNPAFSENLAGWQTGNNVLVTGEYAEIPPGGDLSQYVPAERFERVDSVSPSLVVEVAGGNGEVLVNSTSRLRIAGKGRYTVDIAANDAQSISRAVRITIKAGKDGSGGLKVQWVGLLGHLQRGMILDETGKAGQFYDLIRDANEQINKLARYPCKGFEKTVRSALYSRGIYPDGWTHQNFEICAHNINMKNGIELSYFNPASARRMAQILIDGRVANTIRLAQGNGKIRVCPSNISSPKIGFNLSTSFTPSQQDHRSPDARSLGVMLSSFDMIDC